MAAPAPSPSTERRALSATAEAISRAADELARYRAAAGRDAVTAVRRLEAVGTSLSSAVPGVRGLHLAAVYPNFFQQEEKPSSLKAGYWTIITLNGEQGWFGGNARLGGPGRAKDPVTAAGAETLAARQAFVNVMAGILPGWLQESERFTFTYRGIVDAGPDKGVLLGIDGPNSYAARLLLDGTTHLPRHLVTERQRGAATAAAALNVTYGDYRSVHGVLLPHLILRENDTGVHVRWTIANYTINGNIPLTAFAKPAARRGR